MRAGCGGWSSSPGSWLTVRAAVLAGVPVVVFPFVPVSPSGVRWGFSSAPRGFRSLPSLSRWCGPGRWVRAGSGPVWGLGWCWESVSLRPGAAREVARFWAERASRPGASPSVVAAAARAAAAVEVAVAREAALPSVG